MSTVDERIAGGMVLPAAFATFRRYKRLLTSKTTPREREVADATAALSAPPRGKESTILIKSAVERGCMAVRFVAVGV